MDIIKESSQRGLRNEHIKLLCKTERTNNEGLWVFPCEVSICNIYILVNQIPSDFFCIIVWKRQRVFTAHCAITTSAGRHQIPCTDSYCSYEVYLRVSWFHRKEVPSQLCPVDLHSVLFVKQTSIIRSIY